MFDILDVVHAETKSDLCEGVDGLQVALESTEIRRHRSRSYSVPVRLATRHSAVQQVISIPD